MTRGESKSSKTKIICRKIKIFIDISWVYVSTWSEVMFPSDGWMSDGWMDGKWMDGLKVRLCQSISPVLPLCKTVGEKKKYCKIPFQIPYGFVSTWIYMKAPCCATLLEGESTGGSYKYKGMWDTPAGVWRNIDNSLTTWSLFVFEWRKWRKHKALSLPLSLSLSQTHRTMSLYFAAEQTKPYSHRGESGVAWRCVSLGYNIYLTV